LADVPRAGEGGSGTCVSPELVQLLVLLALAAWQVALAERWPARMARSNVDQQCQAE
jgi:hypothetical protein